MFRHSSAVVRLAALAVAGLLAPGSAQALQSLIPSPYPSDVSGATPLDPETPHAAGPQEILRDPYPQTLGENAQGNPPIARHHRHQHLVPSIYGRKYRVDRP